eukprot:jgi/Orpsp1_1/1182245/evm.model.c7180000080457.1
MCYFGLSKFNFLTSSDEYLRKFGYSVRDGEVSDIEINKIFNEINSNIYTEENARTLIRNIIIASYNVDSARTDYETPSDETLLHLIKFININ